MFRFLTLLIACLALPAPVLALDCDGTDARLGLSPGDRVALDAMTATFAYPEGNHWRATRGDDVVHVVGTVHVDDPRLGPVMARLAPLIRDAALVLVEATPAEEKAMQDHMARDPSLLIVTDGPTLPDLLPEEDWQRVKAAALDRGIPGFMAAKFRPWYLSLMLSLPRCVVTVMQEGLTGLDKRIIENAEAAGVPIEALESYDTLFRLFDAFDGETQAEMVVHTIPAPGEVEDMFAALIAGYFEEKHAEIWTLSHVSALETEGTTPEDIDALFARLRKAVVTDRNTAWVARILNTLDRVDGPVIVAAGAAHLSGSDGLLALLEAEGFTMERMPF